MEQLAILALLGIPAMIVTGFIASLVALSRATAAVKRVDEMAGREASADDGSLARRLAELERTVNELQHHGSAGAQEHPPEQMAQASGHDSPTHEGPPAEPPRPSPPPERTVPEQHPSSVRGTPVSPSGRVAAGGATDRPEPPSDRKRPPTPPRPKVDWESWIGVRGAAVGGGVVLAIAVLMFFRYSIEQGWVTPTLRVVSGMIAGLLSLFGSEWLRKRSQPHAADALGGAGVVILYAATWAAQHHYELIGALPALALMLLITTTCGVLSYARASTTIAVLGLLGGFATPLLVAPDADAPFALFGYLLILDGGLLWLARRRRWPVLALLCLLGTGLHQAIWIVGHLDADRLWVALTVLALFALAFLVLVRPQDGTERDEQVWRWSRAAALVLPFLFAVHLGADAQLTGHLLPLAGLLVILSVCACWLADRQPEPLLALLAAAGTVGSVTLWVLNHRLDLALAWEAAAVTAVIAAVFTVIHEKARGGRADSELETAALIVAYGFFGVLVLASTTRQVGQVWPWLAGWAGQAFLLLRHGRRRDKGAPQLLTAIGLAAGLFLFASSHYGAQSSPHEPFVYLAIVVAVALVFQALSLRPHPREAGWTDHTAAACALTLLAVIPTIMRSGDAGPTLLLGAATILGLLTALAATRLASGPWYLVGVLGTAAIHGILTVACLRRWEADGLLGRALIVQGLTVLVFTAWPLLASVAFAGGRSAWYGAALAAPAWFLQLRAVYESRFGSETIGTLPITLALLSLAAGLRVRAWDRSSPVRASALTWFLAVTLCLVSVAVPLQLEKEWITIGWALNGLALVALWCRLDHPGLKYFGVALLAIATVRLVANPAVLHYHARGGLPVLNWLLYTYLVPAGALIASSLLLRRQERDRLRAWERSTLTDKALCAPGCGLAAVLVVFVWMNLAITHYFGTGDALTVSFERMPGRDATTSVAWAVYALLLVVIGTWRNSLMLRWISLGLLLVTLGKVFLHDLGQLEDLYRVGSLLGLAVCMLLISIVYQRYVLRRRPEET